MFEITLITVGKLKEKCYLSAAQEYQKRLFLSPKADKPTLTYNLAAKENALHAAQTIIRDYAAVRGGDAFGHGES